MEVNETPIFLTLLLRGWPIRWSFLLLLQLWLMQRNIFPPKLAKREHIAEIRATFFINFLYESFLAIAPDLIMKWGRRSTYENSLQVCLRMKRKGRKKGPFGSDRGRRPVPLYTTFFPPPLPSTLKSLKFPSRFPSEERERGGERVGRCGQEMRLFFHWERIATKWPPFSSSFHGRSIFPHTKK